MDYLDKLFDITTYSLVLLCFITAGAMIIETMLLHENRIVEAASITGIGIVTSLFLYWIKGKSNEGEGDLT